MNAIMEHKAGKTFESDFEMIIDVSPDSNNGVFRRYHAKNNPVNGFDPLGFVTMPACGDPTSGFGPRTHPVTGAPGHHDGIDMANPEGAPVYASKPGVVFRVRQGHGNDANSVTIINSDGTASSYSHVASSLSVGDSVGEGQIIGTTDLSGNATGPHLHYEYYDPNENPEGPVDPAPYLEGAEPCPRQCH